MLRWLRRRPAFTLIALASLAIGIGFNTALFTIVDALVFRPLPVERVDTQRSARTLPIPTRATPAGLPADLRVPRGSETQNMVDQCLRS